MIALLLVALFQGAPASTVTAASAAPPAKAIQAETRVCRKETVVGSTIKKRVCARPAEAVAEMADAEDAQQVARDAAATPAR